LRERRERKKREREERKMKGRQGMEREEGRVAYNQRKPERWGR
jgi:hypothetical protein